MENLDYSRVEVAADTDKSGIREKTEFYNENAEDTDFHRWTRIKPWSFFFFGWHPKIKSYFQFAPRAQNVNHS